MLWIALALGEPLSGIVDLETIAGHTCGWRRGEEVPWCWRPGQLASPRPDLLEEKWARRLSTQPSGGEVEWPSVPSDVLRVGASVCAVVDEQVWCQGADWRGAFGMPVGTPSDRPVHVDEFDGAERIGQHGCILRRAQVVCPSPAGPVVQLQGVESFFEDGYAILDDQTLWSFGPNPGQKGEQIVAVSRALQLQQSVDGTIAGGKHPHRPVRDVVGAMPASLVNLSSGGCALTEGGQVTCWGQGTNLSGSIPGDGDLRLYWGEPEVVPGGRAPVCRLKERVVSCASAMTGSPTHPVVRIDDVDELLQVDRYACARRGRELTCFGELEQRLALVGDVVHEEVVAAVAGPYAVYALFESGQIRYASAPSFEVGPPVPGATMLGARQMVVCAATPTELHCRVDNRSVTLPRPQGPFPTDLCFPEGCLTHRPPRETSDTPWIVQRGEP